MAVKLDEEYLYIFLHVPKSAGSTFLRHIGYNFQHNSILVLSPGPGRKLLHRAEVDACIESVPQARKEQIRVICGHGVYYGIHEHFTLKPRYITFLRDPIDRTISHYNFMIENYDTVELEDDRLPMRREDLTFEDWWNTFQGNLETGIVLNYRIDDKPGWDQQIRLVDSHLEEAKNILDKFYFVGLTEKFEEDSLFLYNELKISKFINKKQNVTRKYNIEANQRLIELIRPGVALDCALYEHAVKLNKNFKNTCPDYYDIVENLKANRKYITPIRFVILEALQSFIGMKRTVALVEGAANALKPLISRLR